VAFGRLPEEVRRRATRLVGRTFAAGAVGVLEEDGRLLLVRTVYRRGWGLPGGMLDRGESPERAVVRELREELGLDVEPFGPAATVLDLAAERLDVVFRVRPYPGGPLVRVGEVGPRSVELAEVGWFAVDELPELHAEAVEALAAIADPARSPRVTGA
jgi:8-oxo-dGTP pyrophosphatase MutT (NUDIX family)